MDKLKILYFDEDFWLYYNRLKHSHFKCPSTPEEALKPANKNRKSKSFVRVKVL